jgi:hypothetical protein
LSLYIDPAWVTQAQALHADPAAVNVS